MPDVSHTQGLRPAGPLFTPAHIAAATLLGTPIAGAVVAALNFSRMHRRGAAALALLSGVGAIAVVVTLDAIWSSAAMWLAVPLWTVGALFASVACFQVPLLHAGARSGATATTFVVCVAAIVITALLGASRVVSAFAPDAVPGVAELALDALGMRGGTVRFENARDRHDALRVRRALEHAGALSEVERLAISVTRTDSPVVDGVLTISLQLPDTEAATIDAAKTFSRLLVDHLEPRECVVTRVLSPNGRAELAHGTTCP